MGTKRGAKPRRVSTSPHATEVPVDKSSASKKKTPAPPRAHVYLTPAELAAVQQRAAAERIGVSAYIRRFVLNDLKRAASS